MIGIALFIVLAVGLDYGMYRLFNWMCVMDMTDPLEIQHYNALPFPFAFQVVIFLIATSISLSIVCLLSTILPIQFLVT